MYRQHNKNTYIHNDFKIRGKDQIILERGDIFRAGTTLVFGQTQNLSEWRSLYVK